MARYRKTNRRQRVRVTSRDIAGHRVTRPQGRCTIIWPVPPAGDVMATFLLPGELSLIAPGRHGLTVAVTPAGLIQIAGRSREHVIRLAAEFFAAVARDRLPFAVAAVIGDRARPGEHDVYQVAVVAGHTIAARCAMQPAIIAPGCLTIRGRVMTGDKRISG
jgi:hypothetical protein